MARYPSSRKYAVRVKSNVDMPSSAGRTYTSSGPVHASIDARLRAYAMMSNTRWCTATSPFASVSFESFTGPEPTSTAITSSAPRAAA